MKFTSSTIVLAFAALARAGGGCAEKSSDIDLAVTQFCERAGIMVHSEYAHKGAVSGDAHVLIEGKCDPPQWVPAFWCIAQFNDVCNDSDNGYGSKRFGDNNCQNCIIKPAMPGIVIEPVPKKTSGY